MEMDSELINFNGEIHPNCLINFNVEIHLKYLIVKHGLWICDLGPLFVALRYYGITVMSRERGDTLSKDPSIKSS
jgi:hypothetical protein